MAIRTAWAKWSNGASVQTGPKTSSRLTLRPGPAPSRSTGRTTLPLRSSVVGAQAAGGPRFVDPLPDAIGFGRRDHRPDDDVGVGGVTHAEGEGLADQALAECVVDPRVAKDALDRGMHTWPA